MAKQKKKANKNNVVEKKNTNKKVESKKVETNEKLEQVIVQPKEEKKKEVVKEVHNNKSNLTFICLCAICVLLIITIFVIVTGHQAKLKDGNEVIVSIEKQEYTAQELFDSLKEDYGAKAIVDMVDSYIVKKEITADEEKEAQEFAEKQVKSIKEQYESYGYNWDETLASYGYADEKALIDEIKEVIKKKLL